MRSKLETVQYLGYADRVPDLSSDRCLALLGDAQKGKVLAVITPKPEMRAFHARATGRPARGRTPPHHDVGDVAGRALKAWGAAIPFITFRPVPSAPEGAIETTAFFQLPDGTAGTFVVDTISALYLAENTGAELLVETSLLTGNSRLLASKGVRFVPYTPPKPLRFPDDRQFRAFLARVEPGDFVRYLDGRRDPGNTR